MKNKNLFNDQYTTWPLSIFNESMAILLIILFALLIVGHVGSFLFNCVWFYQPGQMRGCQNQRPIIVVEKKTVELDVVKPATPVPATTASAEPVKQEKDFFLNLGKISVDSNVRNGPGMGYQTITTMQSGAKVEILETRDGWHKIRRLDIKEELMEEPIGWVWSEQIE